MKYAAAVARPLARIASLADPLRPLVQLATRWYVSWQFLQSGWIKVTNWQSTLALFETEYHVPVLPPHAAAVAGAFGELFFPSLIVLGLGGRAAPIGLFFVNIVAVVSYRQVLFADGFEAALAQHVLWGYMLLVLIVFGNGPLALDRWLPRWLGGPAGRVSTGSAPLR
jgi:putative oxidoreductase